MPDRRRAWARALFLAAPDRVARAAFAAALEGLRLSIEAEPKLHAFLADPSVSKAAKAALIAAACGSGEPGTEVFARFCGLIVNKGRAFLLPEIARSFGELRDADEGIARLEVEAAREASKEVLDRIAAAWTAYSGAKDTQARLALNPSLIAGYRLRAGSLRIDYSVAGRLERLRRELARPLGRPQAGAPAVSARGEG